VQRFVERVKNKEDGEAHGLRHRVYKNYDPRAKLVKESADEVLAELACTTAAGPREGARRGRPQRRLLQGASPLPQRRLLHRRDLQGDGLPDADVHAAVRDRAPALAAHWPMQYDPQTKIGRPQQLYIGS
jgi:citrate synthase